MPALLTLTLVLAILAVIAFTERLGLATELALGLPRWIILALVAIYALLSATSRYQVYLDAPGWRSLARRMPPHLIMLLGAIAMLPGASAANPAPVIPLLLAYVITLTLVPARRPMTFQAESDRAGMPFWPAVLLHLCTAFLSLWLILNWLPDAWQRIAGAGGWSVRGVGPVLMATLGFLVIAGGLAGLMRLSAAIMILMILFAGLPMLIGSGLAGSLAMLTAERGFPDFIGAVQPNLRAALGAANAGLLPVVLTGVALGLVSSSADPSGGGAVKRGGFALLVALVAGLTALAFAREATTLMTILQTEILPVQPQNWPIFVFDESLRGWLKVCGEAPRDAIDVIQACRARGVSTPIPFSEFEISGNAAGLALAASRSLPVVFGMVWSFLIPLTCFIALALALQTAAAMFAEGAMFRLMGLSALRSARLLRARLVAMVLTAGLPTLLAWTGTTDPRLLVWLALSLALLAVMTLLAAGMLALVRGLAVWKPERQESAVPGEVAA